MDRGVKPWHKHPNDAVFRGLLARLIVSLSILLNVELLSRDSALLCEMQNTKVCDFVRVVKPKGFSCVQLSIVGN